MKKLLFIFLLGIPYIAYAALPAISRGTQMSFNTFLFWFVIFILGMGFFYIPLIKICYLERKKAKAEKKHRKMYTAESKTILLIFPEKQDKNK